MLSKLKKVEKLPTSDSAKLLDETIEIEEESS
jgi:hypothetical protein